MRVIIVGGGVIGCLTACYLKRAGADPVVLDRQAMGQESSWAGAGILCPIQPWLYPDTFSHLIDASLSRYPALRDTIELETGMSIQWLQSGLLTPFYAQDAGDDYQQALDWSHRLGWNVQALMADEACAFEPTLNRNGLKYALRWPDVAQLRNPRLLKAVRAWMQALEIPLYEQHEVSAIEEAGDVSVVRCGHGAQFEAEHVLLACGSWSGTLAERMGFQLPVQPVKGQIVLLKGEPGLMRHIIKHERLYFVPREDGRILAGASMENVGFKTGNTVRVVSKMLADVQQICPGLSELEIEQQWMGFRPGSPDGMPFLGKAPGYARMWVASGHYRNGVALAPVTAEVMSQHILGGASDVDISAFAVDRLQQSSGVVGYPAHCTNE